MKGLEVGAIDYIGKPFEMEELILKIKNFLKLKKEIPIKAATIVPVSIGSITFIKERMLLSMSNGKQKKLTVRETEILDLLIKNQNQLVLKKDILLQLWGNTDYFNGKSLEVFISRIRKLVNSEKNIRIDSVYGAGYICV
ncbi:winged helix-turn-helix domain-containing protein [Sphingobacterium sp. KU25419]|nr:winged helix-turn-helix domain-containing protein [Sphingobacterium sp. KU25419]